MTNTGTAAAIIFQTLWLCAISIAVSTKAPKRKTKRRRTRIRPPVVSRPIETFNEETKEERLQSQLNELYDNIYDANLSPDKIAMQAAENRLQRELKVVNKDMKREKLNDARMKELGESRKYINAKYKRKGLDL